jgi:putative MATE family efflux protein
MALFFFCGPALIELYLKGEGSAEAAQISLDSGYSYLKIMLIGLIPSTLAQCWSSTLRETGQTLPPMVAGVTAVFANLILNYILIFGHFGAPEMGVDGAAVATVISRFVELLIVAVWTFADRERNIFIVGAFRSLRVPMALVKSITVKGIPLMVNEALWSAGVAFVNRCYSTEGLEVVAANNIAQTFLSVFSVAFLSVGVAIGIILGQLLGAGKEKEAKEASLKLITFSVFVSVIVAILFALSSFFIPDFYNVDESVKLLATKMMIICAVAIPLDAVANACYFTLRSGGEAMITIIFDCGFMWVVSASVAFVLTSFTSLSILPIFAICQGLNFLKDVIGMIFVKKGKWVKRIVE